MRVSCISYLACFTFKEVEVNIEYHALRNYNFMVFFVLARDHEQLFQLFVGFWMLISVLVINPFSNMLHINDLMLELCSKVSIR